MELTIAEIVNLALFAGLEVDIRGVVDDEMESEITIIPCPAEGIKDEDGVVQKYSGSVAYFSDYPDEGWMPLGEGI